MERTRLSINIGLGLAVVAVSLAGTVYLVSTRPSPPRQKQVARIPQVAVIPVQPRTFDAPVVGHGTVQAKRQVKIIPEVGGQLVRVHEDLAIGKVIDKGELLFEIDPRSYQLRVRQAEADIKRLEAELARRQQEKTNLQARLALARELLKQAEANLNREQELFGKDATRQIDVEKADNARLRQQDVVLGYQSQLDLIPHLIAETEALLDLKKAQLAEAQRQAEKTRIYCPFDARVESVSASESQVVVARLSIATLTDLEALELVAGVDPRELQWTELRSFARAVGQDLGTPPEASIVWSLYDRQYTWRGPVTRLERLDEVTRTARVVVEIRDVMEGLKLESGAAKPPLSIGMFCRVEIPAEPLSNALVVPRSALHDEGGGVGRRSKCVYVFEPEGGVPTAAEGRLAMRRVPVLRTVGNEVLVSYEATGATGPAADDARIACELRPDEKIIVSLLPKAVEGMRLRRRIESQIARVEPPGVHRRINDLPILCMSIQVPGDS